MKEYWKSNLSLKQIFHDILKRSHYGIDTCDSCIGNISPAFSLIFEAQGFWESIGEIFGRFTKVHNQLKQHSLY